MPDKKSSKNKKGEDDGDVVEKKSPIVPILVSIIMLGAGYFVGGMMGGGSGQTQVVAGDAEAAVVEEEHHELGELVKLDAINVNLQGGHFLRIAICLETHGSDSGGGHGGDEHVFPTAPAADLLLSTFSGRSVEELSSTDGREHVRQELLEAVIEKYDGEVYGLYFTEFVMQ